MLKEHRLSIRRACSAIEMARSLFYYEHKREDDSVIIDAFGKASAIWLLGAVQPVEAQRVRLEPQAGL